MAAPPGGFVLTLAERARLERLWERADDKHTTPYVARAYVRAQGGRSLAQQHAMTPAQIDEQAKAWALQIRPLRGPDEPPALVVQRCDAYLEYIRLVCGVRPDATHRARAFAASLPPEQDAYPRLLAVMQNMDDLPAFLRGLVLPRETLKHIAEQARADPAPGIRGWMGMKTPQELIVDQDWDGFRARRRDRVNADVVDMRRWGRRLPNALSNHIADMLATRPKSLVDGRTLRGVDQRRTDDFVRTARFAPMGGRGGSSRGRVEDGLVRAVDMLRDGRPLAAALEQALQTIEQATGRDRA